MDQKLQTWPFEPTEESLQVLTICMENPVIPGKIQMARFIPVEIFRKKVIPFEVLRNNRNLLYHLSG